MQHGFLLCYLHLFHQDWHHTLMRGCFYLEEDGTIVSLQYRLHVPEATGVYLTIRPFNLSLIPGKYIVHSVKDQSN